jgi:hypothetical protein
MGNVQLGHGFTHHDLCQNKHNDVWWLAARNGIEELEQTVMQSINNIKHLTWVNIAACLWVPYNLIDIYIWFRETCCLHFQGRRVSANCMASHPSWQQSSEPLLISQGCN